MSWMRTVLLIVVTAECGFAADAEIAVLRGHADQVYSVVFAPDGKHLASVSQDGTVRLWDLREGPVDDAERSHIDELVAALDADQFEPRSAAAAELLALGHRAVPALRAAQNDSDSPEVRFQARRLLPRMVVRKVSPESTLEDSEGGLLCLAISPDGATLAAGGGSTRVKLWDLRTSRVRRAFPVACHGLGCLPNGDLLIASARELTRWNLAEDQASQQIEFPGGELWAVDISRDGRTIAAAGGASGEVADVILWDAASGAERARLSGHTSQIWAVAFSSDGTTIASASSAPEQAVRLWNLPSGRNTFTLRGHQLSVYGVAFSPREPLLATAGADGAVGLWDPTIGEIRTMFTAHESAVNGVIFSPDGRRLATCGADHTIKIWDVARLLVDHNEP